MSEFEILNLKSPSVTIEMALSASNQISQRLFSLSTTVGPRFNSIVFYTRSRVKSNESVRG